MKRKAIKVYYLIKVVGVVLILVAMELSRRDK